MNTTYERKYNIMSKDVKYRENDFFSIRKCKRFWEMKSL